MENCKRFSCILLIFTALVSFFLIDSAAAELEYSPNFCLTTTEGEVFEFAVSPLNQEDSVPQKDKKPRSKKRNQSLRGGKKVTFETFQDNYHKACEFYNKNMFLTAAKLFEELYPLSMGTPLADTILYLFADCYYQNRDYEMAAYHFKEYANRYTTSPRAEDAHFKAIMAISHLSPEYSLDQTETYYVIEEIQVFIRQYPYSSHMEECNELLDEMRDKLAQKSYEILRLYYNTENYRSAQIVAKNFLKEHASSKYVDDAYVILVRNNYDYAQHSVESKKISRYGECIEAYESMLNNCPGSELLSEAKKYADDAQAKIDKQETKLKKKDKKNED